MIVRLTCPGCNRDSYNASVERFEPCPYCGILFSGRFGAEKRRQSRLSNEMGFVLNHQGRFFEASTLNFSERGLSARISGSASLRAGDVLEFELQGSPVKAQVVWVMGSPDNADPSVIAGFRRVTPSSVDSQ